MAIALLLLLLVPASAGAQAKAPVPGNDGRWIVVYERAAVADVDRETEARERRRGFRSRLRFRRAIEGFSATLTSEQVRALRADPDVEAVVPDRPVRAHAFLPLTPSEPVPPTGVRRIGAGAPDFVRGASDVSVAVIDTGVDLDHPDLNVADGTDCVAPGTPAEDADGHGTHVAGSVGALNNGSGVTGVAPGTRIQAVRVLNSEGVGTDASIICGIDWAIANAAARNIRVLNLSLGRTNESNRACGMAGTTLVDPLHASICRASAAGLLPVVAAGNNNWNISEFPYDVPASYPEVLTVTAMGDGNGAPGGGTNPVCGGPADDGSDDVVAPYSNYTLPTTLEAQHTVAAPGTCINSTWLANGHQVISGTSMASPHAAGLAALCIGEAGTPGPCSGMSPAQIVQRMRAEAEGFLAARPGSGFLGDPGNQVVVDPGDPALGNRHYGFLIRAFGPDTAFTVLPPDTTEDPTPTFEFASASAAQGFECRLDGGAWGACASPHTTGELPDGPHQLSVRAVDRAGTPDVSPATDSFTVDRPDPPPAPPTPPPPPPEPADVRAPVVSYSMASRQKIATVLRRGLRVSVACSEPCRLATSAAYGSTTAGRKNAGLASGRRVVTIKLTSAVRRRLARTRSALLRVRIRATDAAGNVRSVSKSVRLTR